MYKTKKLKILCRYYLLCLFSALFTTSALADVVVIVNPKSGIASASSGDVKSVFLGKGKSLGGKSVTPVEQKEGSSARTTFNDKVLNKSDSQLKAYWSKLIFSGKGSPPKSLDDDAAVKAHVAANADAVGYIDSAKADGSVKVILTVK